MIEWIQSSVSNRSKRLRVSLLIAGSFLFMASAWAQNGNDSPSGDGPDGVDIPIAFGAGWSDTLDVPPAFFWSAGEPVFVDDGPFTFSGTACVSVTDAFQSGDQFNVYDNDVLIGTTSVPVQGFDQLDPDIAYLDPNFSSGTFQVPAGDHAITIEIIQNPFDSGRGYIRVDNCPTFEVAKTFSDGNPADVTVELTCPPSVTVLADDPTASIADPANFTLIGLIGECSASENPVLAGYTPNEANCVGVLFEANTTASCTIANQQNAVTILAAKEYEDGSGAAVNFAIDCPGGGTTTVIDASASPGSPAEFEVSDFPVGGTTCNVTEPSPPSGYYISGTTCEGLAFGPGDGPINCAITNAPNMTTFEVTKEFTDGDNPTEVDVTVSCFTGLPLIQSQTISETQSVKFIVESFAGGDLDCGVTEEELFGYTPTYQAGGPGSFDNIDGCNFYDIEGGAENTCNIINDADPVELVIEKDWIIEGMGGDSVSQEYKLTLYCDAEIVGGETKGSSGCGGPLLGAGDGLVVIYEYCEEFYGIGDGTFTPEVIPEYPGSNCWVEETVYDSGVEIDNDCGYGSLQISAGVGASCLITNTVFFEGIPTLSQYGMAILALLMLGLGCVGFRRSV
ncbi:MAG TPA: IPTL-CTERM sorting domain-containing protein [Xanthomonadales bacterium]|nr:IPTL-CTERM sorting domain-containing protein [Xanthomonadales bacterium]